MKRSSLFLSVIVWFSFVLVGCTDCNDDTDNETQTTNSPDQQGEPPAPIDEPPPSSMCGSANSASERSLWNADLSNQHNENLILLMKFQLHSMQMHLRYRVFVTVMILIPIIKSGMAMSQSMIWNH